jgi:transcriptional regulator with XRE-family HTH domain
MNFTELFQTNLRRIRKNSGMTQDALAQKMHVGRTTIANWEIGATSPGPDNFDAIAKALGVGVWELFIPEEMSPQSRQAKSVQESLMTLLEYTQNKLREDLQKSGVKPEVIDLFEEQVPQPGPPPQVKRSS